jgi:long-chain acyl-CoA synthetase
MWLDVAVRVLSEAYPNMLALTDGDLKLTFAAMVDEIEQRSQILRELGVRKGDVIVLPDADDLDGLLRVLAVSTHGAIPLPLPNGMTKEDVGRVASRSGAAWLLEYDERRGEPTQTRTLDRRIHAFLISQQVVAIFETSGTTGPPKLVLHTDASLHRGLSVSLDQAHSGGEIWMSPLALSTIGGYSVVCRSLGLGSALVSPPKAGPRRLLELIGRLRVSNLAVSPALLRLLLRAARRIDTFPHLRSIGVGSAPLAESLRSAASERFDVPIGNGYGSTELGGSVLTSPPSLHGRFVAVPGVDVGLRAPDGRWASPTDYGELYCRPENACAGLIDHTGQLVLPPEDGWFATGDIAIAYGNSTIRLLGRCDDIIFRAGQKFAADEVETVLEMAPEVERAALIQDDDRFGRLVAYIEPAAGVQTVDLARLRSLAKSLLETHKRPGEYRVVARLPVTPTSKVRKYLLHSDLLESTPASVEAGYSGVTRS